LTKRSETRQKSYAMLGFANACLLENLIEAATVLGEQHRNKIRYTQPAV